MAVNPPPEQDATGDVEDADEEVEVSEGEEMGSEEEEEMGSEEDED
jgi:centromere protein C